MKSTKNTIKVSILCLSFNQRAYIKQAIDSFLMQKTDFSFEILINDDASTDGTKEIIKEYQKKYPDIIKPTFHKENQYSQGKRNMIIRYLLPKVQGKYIALCEGDDFWTDPTKLQMQVDFLESHTDYSLVFHPVKVFFENGEREDAIFPERKINFSLADLLRQNFIQTNSVMYRARDKYKDMVLDLMPGDWYLHLYHAQFGKIGFIDQVMAAYRRHEGGIWWSSLSRDKTNFWNTYGKWYIALHTELLKIYNKPEYTKIISRNIENVYTQVKAVNDTIGGKVAGEMMSSYPLATTVLINTLIDKQNILSDEAAKQNSLLLEKNTKIESLETQLIDVNRTLAAIQQSRVWRLRNKLAKYIGRERI